MMTQSIIIQVGQCGNQIGYKFWDSALKEQGALGVVQDFNDHSFFREFEKKGSNNNDSPKIKARALLIDMEEGVVSEIMRGPLRDIFDSNQLLTDVSGSGNNWAVGHFVYGQEHKKSIKELLRKEAEECDYLQTFFLLHSIGGGTGSGLGTSILEMLCDDYPKIHKFVYAVYPSPCDDVITSPYNAFLANNQLIEYADCVFPIENKALGDMCNYIEKNVFSSRHMLCPETVSSSLGPSASFREKPFDCMNDIVANLLLNITCSSRFPGSMNVDLNEIVLNMVPFSRLHFIASSLTPLFSTRSYVSNHRFQNLFSELLSSQHSLFKGELQKGTFLSCALLLRGHIHLSDIKKNMDKLCSSLQFAPWNNDGWKTGLCSISPIGHPYSAVLLSNNSCLWQPFSCLKTHFLKMYNKRAHLHHFLQVSGMEKEIFELSLNNLNCLIEEYKNVGHLIPNEIEKPRIGVVIDPDPDVDPMMKLYSIKQ